jgi:mannose-1-phosphate guanylyltransferase/mannose-6-phosphate isomerase
MVLAGDGGVLVRTWSIVLAGGSGSRLADYVARRFSDSRPKQYCSFGSARTMLQQTVDRATELSGYRVVTVISSGHERWAMPQLADRRGTLIVQPASRDTACGTLLPLTLVRRLHPDAVVHLLPSDHHVTPDDRFVAAIRAASRVAARDRDRIVLLGVAPESAETEYGYISIDGGDSVAPVTGFVEKPTRDAAVDAIAGGALWSTMILAASVDALWTAIRDCLPSIADDFERTADAIGTWRQDAAIQALYRRLPSANLSRDVLSRVADRCLAMRLDGVEWSDWGSPARIESTLARRSAQPPWIRPPARTSDALPVS